MTAYLDNAASTRLHPEVKAAMDKVTVFGNPSSLHGAGRDARRALEDARETVADLLGVDPKEILFTSCATEADNLAIFGVRGRHIVTTTIEHPAILEACAVLRKQGVTITDVGCDDAGRVEPARVTQAITHDTALVSMMLANNEVGTLQTIAQVARDKSVPLHCDAAQACGKVRIRPRELGAELVTLSAHKMNGPRGAGALYVKKGVPLEPMLHGGGQEFARRGGTENIHAAVGLAAALRVSERDMDENVAHMEKLRAKLRDGLSGIGNIRWNGHEKERLCSILNVSFEFVDGEAVILALDAEGVSVSSGSACASVSMEPSHVLKAMGLADNLARGSVRFSVAADTTEEEIDHALRVVPGAIAKLRKISAVGRE